MSWRARSPVAVDVACLAFVGLLVRLALASRDLTVVDRLFIPDDAYYTLAIARSLAHGLGPTPNGIVLTSGFQPLIAFMQVPFFWLSQDLDTPLRASLVGLALCDVGCVLLLARLAYRLGGGVAARVTAALWALSPLAIANALNGLETALALLLQLALVDIWWSARDAGDADASAASATRWYVAAGLVAGLAMLARIDSAFLVGLLGVWELAARRWKPLFTAAGIAALVVAPWWIYCTVRFGSPVPESGQAVRDIVAFHRSIHLTHAKAMGWAAGTLLASPFADTVRLREALIEAPAGAVAAWLALVGLGLAAGWRYLRGASRAFGLHALAVCVFYTFTLPALWFFRRYLVPAEALLAMLWGVAAASLWQRSPRPRGRALVAVASALLVSVGAAASLSWLTQEPTGSVDRGLHGAKGYREAAQEIFAAIPRGAVVGALQSGALSYYRPQGIEVINLDGVVDAHAREAARHHRLADYARGRGITHFVDWPFNLAAFLATSSQTNVTRDNLRQIAVARPQGDDSFLVLEVTWPDDATRSGARRDGTLAMP